MPGDERIILLRANFRDLDQEGRARILDALNAHPPETPHVLLATCYRVELYGFSFPPAYRDLPFQVERGAVNAFRHLVRVAAGMDSPAVGEPQIMAQVREAFRRAGELPELLHQLFERALAAARRIRTETDMQKGEPSVVTLAYREVARRGWRGRVMLVGTGEMAWLSARVLSKRGMRPSWVVSRTRARAEQLASQIGAVPLVLWSEAFHRALREADGLWLATTSPHPLIRPEDFPEGAEVPWIVDLSQPPVVHPDLVSDRTLFLDSLLASYDAVRAAKARALQEGERILEEETEKFVAWLRSRKRRHLLRALEEKSQELEARFVETLSRQLNLPPDQAAPIVRRYVRKALYPAMALLRDEDPVEVLKRWRLS